MGMQSWGAKEQADERLFGYGCEGYGDAGMRSTEKPARFVSFSGHGVVQEGGTLMFLHVKVHFVTIRDK